MDRIELKIEHSDANDEFFITPWFDSDLKMVIDDKKVTVFLNESGRAVAEFKYRWVPKEGGSDG